MTRADLDQKWQWWAGRSEEEFRTGPFASKDDAIQEALDSIDYDEVETEDGWRRLVYFAECRGLHYDCDECGIVPKPCQPCVDSLGDEAVSKFAQTRNAGHVMLEYDD